MKKPSGSWVAMPTPFTEDNKIDYSGLEVLIERQIKYGTSQLFVLGSCGEVTLLTLKEKKSIVKEVVKIVDGRIPVFFNASATSTNESKEFSKFIEAEGGDGAIFTVPPYVLIPQTAVYEHLNECMSAVKIPVGIYNNPTRVGVNIEPETIAKLSENNKNFIVNKEAVGSVEQLVKVKKLCGDRLNILCCDFPKYSIVLPTLAIGGNGTANIGGNIIPEEVANYSKPWDSYEQMIIARDEYFKWFPLLEALYWFSNPIVIKAALNILGLPAGSLRKPYMNLRGEKYKQLERLMAEMGVIDKYGIK